MKKVFAIIATLTAFVCIAIPSYASAPDSTAANLTGEALSGFYNFFQPSLPSWVTTVVTITFGVAAALLPLFQAWLKANPSTNPVTGWVGFILNTATWFVKNNQGSQASAPYAAAAKKKL